ncbi:phage portal protein [Listeria monocytogenes]|nr:phage portal protein [Listeria monocytogenes]
MFERVKNFFRKGGAKLGMIQSLQKITDHPKIAMPQAEYDRIIQNKQLYTATFPDVAYLNTEGQTSFREYHAINTAKIVSRKLAKLVYNDGCTMTVDNKEANDFLQDVLETSKFKKNFGEELEGGYAISGLALRPYFDSKTEKIKIAYCSADCFYPLESNSNDVSEAAIATKTYETENDKTVYYTLLEFHEWINGQYTITNELYRSDSINVIGIKVPLSSIRKYADLKEQTVVKNVTRPFFVYLKLAGKNNVSYGSPLGLGVIDNSKRQLMDINDKYDEFMWEIEEAKTRIVASDHFFKTKYDDNGRPIQRFNRESSVFHKLSADDPFIDEFTPSLRSKEFIESINFILRIVEMNTGFSAGTFSFDGQSVKTATEVVSENTETYQTRTDNVLIVGEALKELIVTIFEMASIYKLYEGSIEFKASVDFDDGVFSSKSEKLEYNTKAVTMGIMSKETAMIKQFGYTKKEAQDELKRIDAEMLNQDPYLQQTKAETSLLNEDETIPATKPTESKEQDSGEENAGEVSEKVDMEGGQTNEEGQTIQQVSLNGAQVQALLTIVLNVAGGKLPYNNGIEMIVAAFPYDRATAKALLGDAGKGFTIEEDE